MYMAVRPHGGIIVIIGIVLFFIGSICLTVVVGLLARAAYIQHQQVCPRAPSG
jgi:hypothetical protein